MRPPELDLRNPDLCRAKLNCEIGRNALDGKSNAHVMAGCSKLEWAVYCLICAVEEIAAHLEKQHDTQQ